jgi:hypothetical protein
LSPFFIITDVKTNFNLGKRSLPPLGVQFGKYNIRDYDVSVLALAPPEILPKPISPYCKILNFVRLESTLATCKIVEETLND